jgi:hypothetical protein
MVTIAMMIASLLIHHGWPDQWRLALAQPFFRNRTKIRQIAIAA